MWLTLKCCDLFCLNQTSCALNVLLRAILPVGKALLTASHAMSDKRTPPAFLKWNSSAEQRWARTQVKPPRCDETRLKPTKQFITSLSDVCPHTLHRFISKQGVYDPCVFVRVILRLKDRPRPCRHTQRWAPILDSWARARDVKSTYLQQVQTLSLSRVGLCLTAPRGYSSSPSPVFTRSLIRLKRLDS